VEKIAPDLVRAQAMHLRGVELDPVRSAELAADVARHADAVLAARGALDFNHEPARFAALLASSASVGRRK
jgi:hypothetical protein